MFHDSKLNNYTILQERIGEGSFGVVMKGKSIMTGEIVALKKIRIKKNDLITFPKTAFRELKTLQHCSHENVLRLNDYFALGSSIVLVFEYCQTDLCSIIRLRNEPLIESHIKCYLQQILRGVAYIHSKKMIHRDIKPANLLIQGNGMLKIGDFGLATLYFGKEKKYSHQVASRWYRSPDLLYGSQTYDYSVDLYSVGMVFAEMLNNSPLLRGESDIDQLTKVIKSFGFPDEKIWPGVTDLPDFNKINFPPSPPMLLKDLLPCASPLAIDLFKNLVVYDPKKRFTAKQALCHDYFFTEPLPVHPSKLDLEIPKRDKKFDSSLDGLDFEQKNI